MGSDDETLRFYAENAGAYARRDRRHPDKIDAFLMRLKPGARVLELGCGAGDDAAYMLDRGFEVLPTDGSPALAAEAERRTGRPVLVMRFDELAFEDAFDGVWASASLLHVPAPDLPGVLSRVHRALRLKGVFWASYKSGGDAGRDRFGRYYNRPGIESLEAAYMSAAPWADVEIAQAGGSGYDGEATAWLWAVATK